MPPRTNVIHAVHRFGLSLSIAMMLAVAGCAAPSPQEGAGAPGDAGFDTGSGAEPARAAPATGAPVVGRAAVPARRPPAQTPPVRDLPVQGGSRLQHAPRLDPPPSRSPPDPASLKISPCTTDADCTVKNVGNCCGYYPACVSVDTPADPAAVKAQCAKTGMASVCGFPAITSCQCVAGACEGGSRVLPQ